MAVPANAHTLRPFWHQKVLASITAWTDTVTDSESAEKAFNDKQLEVLRLCFIFLHFFCYSCDAETNGNVHNETQDPTEMSTRKRRTQRSTTFHSLFFFSQKSTLRFSEKQ